MRFAREFDAAYEVVAVTGALPAPEPRFERALVVGGRIFVVIGAAPVMEARLVTRTGEDSWLSEPLFETRIEPLLVQPAAPPVSGSESGRGRPFDPHFGRFGANWLFLEAPRWQYRVLLSLGQLVIYTSNTVVVLPALTLRRNACA